MTVTAGRRLRILVVEPYCGGSHETFLSGLRKLPHDFEVRSLPARKWKWRMRLSAPHFAEMLFGRSERFDRILCSTFLDVAAFRGLAPRWVREVPLLTYFHENQFSYPVQVEDERDFHFALTNVTTALASDSLAFNSRYNLESFLDGARSLLRHADDMSMNDLAAAIHRKSRVLPPGIDFREIDSTEQLTGETSPVIVWNHRWEHDKGPEKFFDALYDLDEEGMDFRLIVLGQSFERRPKVFDEARQRLAHRTLHFGFAASRTDYARWLRRSDVAVSTARHEFFGIAVLEAVRAGCRPVLPKRLSYPELFPEEYLYGENDFMGKLRDALHLGRLSPSRTQALTEAHTWEGVLPAYCDWLENPGNRP